MGARAPRRWAAVLAASGALALAPAARAVDPAVAALRTGDAYVAPGPGAVRAHARLEREARRLGDRGQEVKLAVVAGPAGAPSMRDYVADLRAELPFAGTLVVSAPGRPVIAEGPRSPAEITRALRRDHVNRRADPVDRVLAAARLAAPPPPAGSSLRGVLGLAALAVLGGAWAAAWGIRRERRHSRVALVDARARVRLRVDALRARALALRRRADLPPAARRPLEAALALAGETDGAMDAARSPEDVGRAQAGLARGERLLGEAAALAGDDFDPGDPYAGLCAADPGHGPARARAALADREGDADVCAACAAAARAGDPRARRVVPVAGRPVPFDEADAG